jgi:hypothetical protein
VRRWHRQAHHRNPGTVRSRVPTTAWPAPHHGPGWDRAGPWDGYCLDWSDLASSASRQPPAASSLTAAISQTGKDPYVTAGEALSGLEQSPGPARL